MKKRGVVAVVVLSLVTAGIYDLYWLIKTKNHLNKTTSIKTPSVWLLFLPVILSLGAFIAVAVTSPDTATTTTSSSYSASYSTNLDTTTSSANTVASIIAIIVFIIAMLISIPITFLWFFKFAKALHEYTRGEMSTALTLILLWALRFIGIAVIQDKFNDMIDAGYPNGYGLAQASAVPGGQQVAQPQMVPAAPAGMPVAQAPVAPAAPQIPMTPVNPVAPVAPAPAANQASSQQDTPPQQ